MIELTRLNGSKLTINAEIIETLEGAPDSTIVSLATSNRYNVRESVEAIIEKVIQYRKKLNGDSEVVNPIEGFERY